MYKNKKRTSQKDTNPSRVAIYARVSTRKQVRESYDSIDSQIDSCREVAAQSGGNVVMVLKDLGVSGTKASRPEYKRLLQAIRSGEVDKIIIVKIDRLNRSVTDGTALIDMIKKHGIELCSVTEPDSLNTH